MAVAGCVPTIHILPGDVVSRIAAGEVIERPAAVVKELVENSLDAGSRRISIEVKDGGLSLIRVTDDGAGIGRIDLPLAFQRHATSKLTSDQDLAAVTTMGFRGEALPSIASVSKVAVTTFTGREAVGTHLTLVGGVVGAVTDAPPVQGTRLEVSDLFYNQPARKKFLRARSTEFSHISHAVQQAALAWSSVHFRLTHNGHEILNYPAVTEERDRILQVYGRTFLTSTVEVLGRVMGYVIRGVVVDPVQGRTAKTPQDLFVNRRPVRSSTVFHAVTRGYASLLAKGCHPTFVLYLEADPDKLDVNVHPAKREIRFAETDRIHQLVVQTLRRVFSGPERTVASAIASDLPRARLHEASPAGISVEGTEHETGAHRPAGPASEPVSDNQLTWVREFETSYGDGPSPDIVPFGQMLRRYVIAQVGQEMHVIDQHTAHERVLFQRIHRTWQRRKLVSQPLLIPETVELSAAEFALLTKHLEALETLGLAIEPFGATAVAVRSVPVGTGDMDIAALLRDLLDDVAQWDRISSLDDRVAPILASLACHSAVRAGRHMALPEIRQLVRDWVEEGLVMTCPHGRRTAFRMSRDELDKLFGRVGWT
ncbi:MAG: DNA mismatch repair endonuclease MutL [Nitrospira sp.]|nr:DNA mismatch repair endonuclease MutL [Nitrospira sp.]